MSEPLVAALPPATARDSATGLRECCAVMLDAERERISHDLHDDVIQRLFAAGLALSQARLAPQPIVGEVVERVVADLDATVGAIRSVITGLDLRPPEDDFSAQVRAVVEDATRALGHAPSLLLERIAGVPVWLRPQVLAVLREALSNVVRHAAATSVEVRVSVDPDGVNVRVSDDGRGLAAATRRSGLRNLAARAVRFGGHLECAERPGGGTSLHWSVPGAEIRPGWSPRACAAAPPPGRPVRGG